MPDIPNLPNLENALGIDMNEALAAAREQAENAEALHERLSELKGRAKTKDGHIKLSYSPKEGLPDLHIDPRAMRMSADELATMLQRLVREAMSDLEKQKHKAAKQVTGQGFQEMNINKAKSFLDNISDVTQSATADAEEMVQKVRDGLNPR